MDRHKSYNPRLAVREERAHYSAILVCEEYKERREGVFAEAGNTTTERWLWALTEAQAATELWFNFLNAKSLPTTCTC